MHPALHQTQPARAGDPLLTVVGDLVEDVVVWTAGAVARGTDNASVIQRCRGGSGANVAAFAAQQCRTRFLGRVGDDALGRRLVDELTGLGVDVRVQRGGRTGSIVVLVDPSGERTMFPDRGASAELAALPPQWAQGSDALHVTAYNLADVTSRRTVLDLVVSMRTRANALISIDVSSCAVIDTIGAQEMRTILTDVRPDVVFANADEARQLQLVDRPMPGVQAVVKNGSQPVTIVGADAEVHSLPVPAVADVRDTTGAGDAFAAGYLVSLLRGADAVERVAAGAALAGRVLRSPGPQLAADNTQPDAPSQRRQSRRQGRSIRTQGALSMNRSAQQRGIVVSTAVSDALAQGRPVVALESTIFSNLGLPAPANAEALERCQQALAEFEAVPALTAVLDGVPYVGLDETQQQRVLQGTRKVAERDLAVAVAQRWDVGVTTVSATTALAHAAGIDVFATGGIGGVHRGAELTGDVSADLDALAHHPVVTVCAGAKAFLDLPRTLEYLETVGVPVLGWQTEWFPAFYSRSSGVPVPHSVSDAQTVAGVLRNRTRADTGVLLCVPIPVADELNPAELDAMLTDALRDCAEQGISGAAVTPFVLGRLGALTEGRSVPANLALAENNARVAAEVARALSLD